MIIVKLMTIFGWAKSRVTDYMLFSFYVSVLTFALSFSKEIYSLIQMQNKKCTNACCKYIWTSFLFVFAHVGPAAIIHVTLRELFSDYGNYNFEYSRSQEIYDEFGVWVPGTHYGLTQSKMMRFVTSSKVFFYITVAVIPISYLILLTLWCKNKNDN